MYKLEPVSVLALIHLSIGAAPVRLNNFFTFCIVFSNAKVSSNTCLRSGSGMALSTAETNLCKKSAKPSPEPCLIFVTEVDFFLGSSTLSQALKVTKWHCSTVCHQIESVLGHRSTDLHPASDVLLYPSPRSILPFNIQSFFLHHVNHCSCRLSSSIAVTNPFQSWGIILFE